MKDEIWQNVRDKFLEYARRVKAHTDSSGWASLYAGRTDRYVECFGPIIEDLVAEHLARSGVPSDELEQLIFNEIALGVYGPIRTPTYPWTPKELLAEADFRAALIAAIAKEIRRVSGQSGNPVIVHNEAASSFQGTLSERPAAADRTANTEKPTSKASSSVSAGKPLRRNARYKAIDEALHKIAESRPRTQEEIFQYLERQRVVIPPAEPFTAARGWMAGFQRDTAAARAWLSKRWAELDLPPLPRGPKSPKK